MAKTNSVSLSLRRQYVFEKIVAGMQISQIAQELQLNKGTISKDVQYLVKDSEKYLSDTARRLLPFYFRRTVTGLENILYMCIKRYNDDSNLFALKLAIEAHKEIMNTLLNGVSVMAVRRITDKANSLGITIDGR